MIQLVPQMRVLVAVGAVDFRRGIDALAALCRRELAEDPFSGTLFVFRNRSGTAIKLLVYDGLGFWLCLKRFSRGRLQWWPSGHSGAETVTAQHLAILLAGGTPLLARIPEDWRRIR